MIIETLYSWSRSLLFRCDPETVHHWMLQGLSWMQRIPGWPLAPTREGEPVQCFGLSFPNRVGLAAGLDKNAECVPFWQSLGFGFVEVGTVTPRAQRGNPKPRLFRLVEEEAIINRMGFNNRGIDYVVQKLALLKQRYCPIGINIGKNADTSLARASEDYVEAFTKAYRWADYVTVNLSSPNTPGLRTLQQSEFLRAIVAPLIEQRKRLMDQHEKSVPILVKIAPDLTADEVSAVVTELLQLKIEGIIATNTTLDRTGVGARWQEVAGGLSGAPLRERSTQVVAQIYRMAGAALPIIAVGGILTPEDAQEKRDAGAVLVQLYTGLIYRGLGLIRDIKCRMKRDD